MVGATAFDSPLLVSPIDSSSPKREESRSDEDESALLTPPPEHKAHLVSATGSSAAQKGLPPLPPRPYSPTKKASTPSGTSQTTPKPSPPPPPPASAKSSRHNDNNNSIKLPMASSPTGSKASVQTSDSFSDKPSQCSSNPAGSADLAATESLLNESLEKIANSKQQIDLTANELASGAYSPPIPLLQSLIKRLTVPCSLGKLPLTIRGGAEKALMIVVDCVYHPDLMNSLHHGDIILSIENTCVSGMILRDANALLQTFIDAQKDIEIEFIPEGKMPSDLRSTLSDKTWSDLQSVIRDNVYARTVPFTTRPPKSGEVDGEHYKFVTVEAFIELQRNEMLLEQGCFQGHFYGTPRPDDVDDNSSGILIPEELQLTSDLPEPELLSLEPLDMVNAMTVLPSPIDDNQGPLPPNWEIAYSDSGEKYFIDHNTGTTQWEDPRDLLPEGWERVDDEQHGTFYVDHINKKTQYERPTFGNSPKSSDSATHHVASNHKQHHSHPHHQHQHSHSSTTPFNGSNGHHPVASSSNVWNNGNGSDWPPTASGPTASHAPQFSYQQPPQQNAYEQKHPHQNGAVHHTAPHPAVQPQPQHQHQHSHRSRTSPRGAMSFAFTSDPAKLRGELLTTRIKKGPKGLGFTLIGNDSASSQPEFIQVKSIIPNGPAANDNVLHPGDILVYVNNEKMLGATQENVCHIFRSIPVGDSVTLQVCRGYPLLLDPTNRIITENVYHRPKEHVPIEIHKRDKGYGFTLEETSHGQRVKAILHPEQCPNLMSGDIIYEIDGQYVRNLPHVQVIDILKRHPPGYKTTMVVARTSPRHRSRTPTAGFRYGAQRTTPVPVLQPRSKTPAPVPLRPEKSAAIRQYQPQDNIRPVSKLNGNDIYENTSRMRPSSTTLGFASTPSYVPIAAYAHDKPQGHQMITVNLLRKDGFGFRLIGGQDTKQPLTVGEIVPGGPADLDGRLRENDEIIEIDGQRVEFATHMDAVNRIKRAQEIGHIKMVVRRIRDDLPRSTSLPFAYNYPPMGHHVAQAVDDMPPMPTATAYPVDCGGVYDVDLAKLDSEDFGCTIMSLTNRYIGKIIPNSPAHRCGRLHPGDCVVAINGCPTSTMSHQQVINFIKSSGNTITFTIDASKRLAPSSLNLQNGVKMDPLTRNGNMNGNGNAPVYAQMPHRRYSSNYGAVRDYAENGSLISVCLARGNKGFGFSIRGGWEFGQMPLKILKIADDGPAAENGMLRVGDLLVEINGESTMRMTHERAIDLIKSGSVVQLLVQRPIVYGRPEMNGMTGI